MISHQPAFCDGDHFPAHLNFDGPAVVFGAEVEQRWPAHLDALLDADIDRRASEEPLPRQVCRQAPIPASGRRILQHAGETGKDPDVQLVLPVDGLLAKYQNAFRLFAAKEGLEFPQVKVRSLCCCQAF